MNLQKSLPTDLRDNSNEISVYQSGKVTPEVLADGIIMLKKAFPKLPLGWYDVLDTMLDEEKFNNIKFKHAVNNLIKTCPYPEPTIANIIGFDKKVKVYNYQELMKLHAESYYPGAKEDPVEKYYYRIKINDGFRFVKKEEFIEGVFVKA